MHRLAIIGRKVHNARLTGSPVADLEVAQGLVEGAPLTSKTVIAIERTCSSL